MDLEIKFIRTDGGTQARAKLDPDTVDEYRDAFRDSDGTWPFPPVIAFHDGSAYWLADGFHRIAAARLHGRFVCEADVRQGTQRDAVLFAAGANADHGLRRTNDDKRRAVLRLLEDAEWGQWSDREIARRCKVSHPFVGAIRAELKPVTGNVSSERAYTTKHGTVATMKTGNIGARQPEPYVYQEGRAYEESDGDGYRTAQELVHVHASKGLRSARSVYETLSNPDASGHEYAMGLAIEDTGLTKVGIRQAAAELLADLIGPEATAVPPAPIVETYNGADYRRETITNEHGQTETRWQPIQEAPAPDPVFALLKQAERALGEAIIKFNVDTHFHALGKVNSVYSALLAAIRVYEYGSEV